MRFLQPPPAAPIVLGRSPEADITLEDSVISRKHVSVGFAGEQLIVTDLGSTNGSYLGGEKLDTSRPFRPGMVLQVGAHTAVVEWRNPLSHAAAAELAQDLEKASRYVESLLPERISEGPVRLDWAFQPSAKLGGDVFGYHPINRRFLAGYLIDVTGHGVGAAMHSTSILAALRQMALPHANFTDPSSVLKRLNDTFSMDDHDGYCFTIWYGAFDLKTRVLRYASAGHHPAFLVGPDGGAPTPLRVRNPMMGVLRGIEFASAQVTIAPGARLHVFSDGCFEITDRSDRQWRLADFLPLLTDGPDGRDVSATSILATVRKAAKPGPLADDFSIMSVEFE